MVVWQPEKIALEAIAATSDNRIPGRPVDVFTVVYLSSALTIRAANQAVDGGGAWIRRVPSVLCFNRLIPALDCTESLRSLQLLS